MKCGFLSSTLLLFGTCSVLDPISSNIVLNGFMKCRLLDDTHQLFDKMPIKGYVSTVMRLTQRNCKLEVIGRT